MRAAVSLVAAAEYPILSKKEACMNQKSWWKAVVTMPLCP